MMSDDTKGLVQRLREPIPWERTTRGDRPTYQLWENHTMMVDAQRDQAAYTIERLERELAEASAASQTGGEG